MPPIVIRPLLLLAGAVSFTAIQVSAAAPQILLHSDPQSVNCPVTLYAQPRFTGGVTLLVPGQASKRDRAGVHLRLEDPDGRPIRGAEIILCGLAATHGAQPASLSSSTQPTQSFHVVGSGDTPGVLIADLWLAHAVTIESVSVTAVDFASAPAWKASKASSCITVPNGNRLVGSLR